MSEENWRTVRWRECAAIGEILGLRKDVVHNGLTLLKDRGLVGRILARNEDAIREALSLRWHGYDGSKVPYQQGVNMNVETPDELAGAPVPAKGLTETQKKLADVKLMMWVVDKIGDIEKAKKAFFKVYKLLVEDEDNDAT